MALGLALRRQWTYGRTVAFVAALLFVVQALSMWHSWSSIEVGADRFLAGVRVKLAQGTPVEAGDAQTVVATGLTETDRKLYERYEWVFAHWRDLFVGGGIRFRVDCRLFGFIRNVLVGADPV